MKKFPQKLQNAIKFIIDNDANNGLKEERAYGVRNVWFGKGIRTGTLIATTIMVPKFRLVIGALAVAELVTNGLRIANLNNIENARKLFMESILSNAFNKPPSGNVPPSGTPLN